MSKVRIGDLFELEKGSLQSSKCTEGEFDFITASKEWKTHNDFSHDFEALIFAAMASGSLGRTHYVNGKFITSDLCYILTPKDNDKFPIDLKFYHFVFNSLKEEIVKNTKSGTSKEAINQTNLKNYEIPYFGIEQQHLWIEKLLKTKSIKEDLTDEAETQQTLLKKLRQKIVIFYDNAYKELSRIHYTNIQIIWSSIFVFILLFIVDFFIISYSPFKYLIPNYPTKEVVNTMKINNIMLDSIRQSLENKNKYITNLIKILKNDSLENYNTKTINMDSGQKFPQIKNVISREDSLLRQEIEEQEMFSANLKNNGIGSITNLYQINFFSPVKGVISNDFNPNQNHFGTDIVASPNQLVLAALNGTVINASWASRTGYTVIIQHKSDIITVYKHLSNIIVKDGDNVIAGQPIATVGNSGELSTGPHLHFELWQHGTPLNAREYISFK